MILVLLGFLFSSIPAYADYADHPEVNRQYKFFVQPKTWHEARVACKLDGAELAMPMNDQEAAILATVFNEHPASAIPGYYVNRALLNFHDLFEQGEFVLDRGDTIQYAYHKWAKGEPKIDNERCGSMDRAGDLDDFPCDQRAPYICQKGLGVQAEPPSTRCSTNDIAYKEFDDACYKLHIEPRTWYDARAICHAEGSYLAIVASKTHEDHLLETMNRPEYQVTYVERPSAFVGIHDRFQEGLFMAVSGSTLDEIGYANWRQGQPDNKRGREDCGSLHKEGGFEDVHCNTPLPFICQRSINDERFYNKE